MKHDDECGNYGNSIFSVEEVHKIAILDIRIINCDRNDQNILVKKTRAKGKILLTFLRSPHLSRHRKSKRVKQIKKLEGGIYL